MNARLKTFLGLPKWLRRGTAKKAEVVKEGPKVSLWLPDTIQKGFTFWKRVETPVKADTIPAGTFTAEEDRFMGIPPELEAVMAAAEMTPVIEPAPVEASVAKKDLRLGWITGAAFVGTYLALLVGRTTLDHHSATSPSATKTSPGTAGTQSAGAKAPATDEVVVNHEGSDRGFDVWNQTDEALEIFVPNGSDWRLVGTLDPGAYLAIPCKRGPNLKVLFKSESIEHQLVHVFGPGDREWYREYIKKS